MKNPPLRWGWLLLALPSWGLLAADIAPPVGSNEAELGFSHESLDKGYGYWDSQYLDLAHRFDDRSQLYGEVRDTNRFNLHDREVSAGYAFPISSTWSSTIEASASPDHNVLPQNSLGAQLQKSFDEGWDVQAAVRHSRYTLAPVDVTRFTGERYWGNFRASYSVYLAKVDNAGIAPSHNGQFSYYFGDRNYVTLSYAQGRQVESLGPGQGVLTANVTSSTSLSGRYWLNRDWGVSYEAVSEHLSNLYSRKGIRLGLRRLF
ncbi:MAG: YaiO family outer membrane beta-barrel protein [Betaproteobacteria bacterium]|nr:YaiO family outer membrane beta-barrel protein [Betaproteobacteria bacterium]